jgi:anti-sigma regulatory factor (Ser/Thr protein kinase)
MDFTPSPHAVRATRQFLRETLRTWRLDSLGAVPELLADELVSNVVRHVGAPGTVRALRNDHALRVEVDDPSDDAPVVCDGPGPRSSGYGLVLVAELADRWGVEPRPLGKTVWFELDVDGR